MPESVLFFVRLIIAASIIPDVLRLNSTLYCPGINGIYSLRFMVDGENVTVNLMIDENSIDYWVGTIPSEAPNRIDAIFTCLSDVLTDSVFPMLELLNLPQFKWVSDLTMRGSVFASSTIFHRYISTQYHLPNLDSVSNLEDFLTASFPDIPVTNGMIMAVLSYWADPHFYITD